MEHIITVDNFETEVLQSDLPVAVDFSATWCGPCRMLSPVIESIAEEYDDRIKIGKVNVDEQMPLAARFNISTIPTIMLFEKGEGRVVAVGYKNREDMVKLLGL